MSGKIYRKVVAQPFARLNCRAWIETTGLSPGALIAVTGSPGLTAGRGLKRHSS
ncbi:hypothetical protein CCP2SC5_790004 [Azospirillaceae bacterium]